MQAVGKACHRRGAEATPESDVASVDYSLASITMQDELERGEGR